jgi:DNA-binding GntR family transcriptional regulator
LNDVRIAAIPYLLELQRETGAMYYNSAEERRTSLGAHDRIIEAIQAQDVERLIDELSRHRERALTVLRGILPNGKTTP